jgi:hypothetical protein
LLIEAGWWRGTWWLFLNEENLPVSQKDLEALRDPKGQKGVQWRMQKLDVIRKLVKAGKSRAWVIWFLRTNTGLTLPTAKALISDAFLEEPKGEAEEMPGILYDLHFKGLSDAMKQHLGQNPETSLSARGGRSKKPWLVHGRKNTPEIQSPAHPKHQK